MANSVAAVKLADDWPDCKAVGLHVAFSILYYTLPIKLSIANGLLMM